MAERTGIEWTDATWNPIGGCSIKSPGCTNCYAQRLAGTRLAHLPLYVGTTSPTKAGPVFNGRLTAAPYSSDVWTWPLRWRGAKNPKLGPCKPSMIFVGDMADLFHEDRPRADIDRVVAAIIYSPHIGQFLTKRPDVMRDYFIELRDSGRWMEFDHPLLGRPNCDPITATFDRVFARCWAMTSVEDQPRADERIPILLEVPLPVRGISAEPLLGPVDIRNLPFGPLHECDWKPRILDALTAGSGSETPWHLDWVIVGGESGPSARPMLRSWAQSLRDQCAAAGVAFFHKQNGEYIDADEWLLRLRAAGVRITKGIGGPEWNQPTPLNFTDAAELARFGGFDFEHQSDGTTLLHVGKARAGRTLDGREHSEMPG